MGSARIRKQEASNHRGILMSASMIRAYQKGWKCMTRRTRGLDKINVRPDDWALEELTERGAVFVNKIDTAQRITVKQPYGWVGGFLYFKETYARMCRVADPLCYCETEEEIKKNHYIEYKADTGNAYPGDWPAEEARGNDEAPKWKSSLFMPRECARFHDIPITGVRVERLHEMISNPQDAILEGVERLLSPNPKSYGEIAVIRFMDLWNSLNAKRGHGWHHNDWVWVYEFPYSFEMEVLYGTGEGEPVGILKASDIIEDDL